MEVITGEGSQGKKKKKKRSPRARSESVYAAAEYVRTRPSEGLGTAPPLWGPGSPGRGAFRAAGDVLSLGAGHAGVRV